MAEQRQRRGPLIALVVVAFATCLALGWWQWERYSTGGTFQNLGYAFQWPLFAVFFVYAYRRFVVLEAHQDEPTDEPEAGPASQLPPDLLPARPPAASISDEPGEMSDYNAYLASLATQEANNSRSQR
ncbi:MAG: hypothetical protein M3Y26_08175 [Actinomycetota bacterium]|nr:hypothetical protein [Actinomycetota bacterium]